MTPPNADDLTLRRAYLAVAIAGAALAVGALVGFGAKAGWSVAAGALVAWGNLWALAFAVKNLLGGAQVKWSALAILKFIVLLAVTFVLIRSGAVLPLGLAVGFGALPLGIFVAGVFGAPADTTPSSPGPSVAKETDHA